MRVILIAQTSVVGIPPAYFPHPSEEDARQADELAEIAGRQCYESWGRPNPETATNEGYLANIIKQQHFSVLEHASATFYIDGVSRNFTHELIRHRHLSFSEVSQRYVDVSESDWVNHPGLAQWFDTDPETDDGRNDWAETIDNQTKGAYRQIVHDLTTHHGYSRKEARQAARHVLPSGLETKIVVTGNHRAWREVLAKRLSPAADREFQLVARELLNKLKVIAPNTYQDISYED